MAGRLGEHGADPALLDQQVVPGLEVHPELAGVAEIVRQPKRGVGGDASPAQDDLVDAARRHAEIHRNPVLADAEGGEELLREDFAGVDGREHCHDVLSAGDEGGGMARPSDCTELVLGSRDEHLAVTNDRVFDDRRAYEFSEKERVLERSANAVHSLRSGHQPKPGILGPPGNWLHDRAVKVPSRWRQSLMRRQNSIRTEIRQSAFTWSRTRPHIHRVPGTTHRFVSLRRRTHGQCLGAWYPKASLIPRLHKSPRGSSS